MLNMVITFSPLVCFCLLKISIKNLSSLPSTGTTNLTLVSDSSWGTWSCRKIWTQIFQTKFLSSETQIFSDRVKKCLIISNHLEKASTHCLCLEWDSQNFLSKFIHIFITLGLYVLRFVKLIVSYSKLISSKIDVTYSKINLKPIFYD